MTFERLLHFAEYARCGDHERDDSSCCREEASGVACRAPYGSLEQVCTLLTHQAGKLTGNRTARSILAEREPGDRDHDEQDRTDRHDGVKGNRRPSGEAFIIDERLDACP